MDTRSTSAVLYFAELSGYSVGFYCRSYLKKKYHDHWEYCTGIGIVHQMVHYRISQFRFYRECKFASTPPIPYIKAHKETNHQGRRLLSSNWFPSPVQKIPDQTGKIRCGILVPVKAHLLPPSRKVSKDLRPSWRGLARRLVRRGRLVRVPPRRVRHYRRRIPSKRSRNHGGES